jgi:hypothetical protein
MKYLAFLALVVISLSACKEQVKGKNGIVYKDAVEYNDYIVGRQSKIVQDVMDFLKATEVSLDSAKTMLSKYPAKVDVLIQDVKGMPPYKGDSVLRNTAIDLFGFYKKIFENEYKQIIDIRISGNSGTEEGVAEMERLAKNVTTEEEKYDKAFHNAQADFADKNKISLKKNEMQEKFNDAIKDK